MHGNVGVAGEEYEGGRRRVEYYEGHGRCVMSQWLPAQEGDAGFTSHQTPLFTFGSFTDEEARQLQYGSQAPPIPATGHQNFLSNSHDSTGFTTNHHPRSQHEEIPHDGRSSGVVLDVNIDEGQRRLKKAAEEAEKGDARRELSEILDHIDLNLYRDGGGEKGVEDKKGIKPPGLMNHGNTCYLSATIQCLLNLPVFKKLLSEVREVREAEAREGFAVLHALCALEETMLVGDGGAIDVTPLLGTLMRERKDFQRLFPRGSQQDAQEFAQWLLDVLSDEHLAHLAQQSGGDNGNSDDDGGWQEAGKGGKGAVKLNHVGQGKKTYISRIFGGAMRTSVKVPGVKSSVTVQPFSSLHIDVQSRYIASIEVTLNDSDCNDDEDDEKEDEPGMLLFLLFVLPVVVIGMSRMALKR